MTSLKQTPRPIVLCVDDDETVLEAIRETLRGELSGQATIETVSSGNEAIEVVDEALEDGLDVAVVISDEIMPQMRGHELLRELAQRIPEASAILLTGQASTEDVGAAVNSGMLETFIQKPWKREHLVTAVKQALGRWRQAQELRTTRGLLDFVMRGDPSAVVVLDASGQPVEWNPAAEPMVARLAPGATLASLPGVDITELQATARDASRGSGEKLVRSRDDPERFYQQAVYGPGPHGAWVYRMTDVSESVHTSHALERSLAEAGERQRAAAIGLMTGAMVHELNNYLFVIGATAEMMQEGEPEGEDLSQDLAVAIGEARDLSGQVMRFLRDDPGPSTSVEIGTALRLAADFARRIGPTDAVIEVSMPDHDVHAWFSRVHLQQIILNLLKNALEACSDGPASARVEVIPGTPLRIRVSDNGPGIPPHIKRRLFSPFITSKADGKGSGIGLTISRRLAQSHGGELRLLETSTAGTTFELELRPAHSDPSKRSHGPDTAESIPLCLTGMRVLALEDHPGAQRAIRWQLEALGAVDVGMADQIQTFRQLLESLDAEPPDLVVSDLLLPDGSWSEVVAAIAATRYAGPVLFVSAHASAEILDSFPLDNPRGFLSKPFSRAQLGEAIEQLLDRPPAS